MITELDLKHLKRCVELAEEALGKGDQPFGSILVSGDGGVLFEDHNHEPICLDLHCILFAMNLLTQHDTLSYEIKNRLAS